MNNNKMLRYKRFYIKYIFTIKNAAPKNNALFLTFKSGSEKYTFNVYVDISVFQIRVIVPFCVR